MKYVAAYLLVRNGVKHDKAARDGGASAPFPGVSSLTALRSFREKRVAAAC